MYRTFLQPYGYRKPPPGTPVNRQHPIGRRLVCSLIFNKAFIEESGGWRFYDSAGSDLSVVYNRTNADTFWTGGMFAWPVFKLGANGGQAALCDFSKTLSAIGPYGLRSTSLTVIGRYLKTGANPNLESTPNGSGSAVVSTRRTGADVAGFILDSTASTINWCADGSGLLVGATASITLSSDIFYTLAGTYLRDTSVANFGGYWSLYWNGTLQGTNNLNTAGTFGGTFTDNAPTLGYDNTDTTTNMSDKEFDYLHIFNDCLSAGEVATVTREPFCMYGAAVLSQRQYLNAGAAAFIAPRPLVVSDAVRHASTW